MMLRSTRSLRLFAWEWREGVEALARVSVSALPYLAGFCERVGAGFASAP